MLKVQVSDNGKDWTYTGDAFRSKVQAKAWFDQQWGPADTYDWRVGFLLLTRRDGTTPQKFYRLVHPNGNQVNP